MLASSSFFFKSWIAKCESDLTIRFVRKAVQGLNVDKLVLQLSGQFEQVLNMDSMQTMYPRSSI